MTIVQVLSDNALRYGDEIAVIDLNYYGQNYFLRNEMNWREFERLSNQVAHYLLSRKICPTSKIAILMNNCRDWLIIYFGIIKAGAIVVPINCLESAGIISHCLNLTECSLIFCSAEFNPKIDKVIEGLLRPPDVVCLDSDFIVNSSFYQQLLTNLNSSVSDLVIDDESPAAIYFSSGTTGVPKAVLHSHKALLAAAVIEKIHHGQNHDDVFLCLPPMYHTGAMIHWLGGFLTAGKVVLMKRISPLSIIKAIAYEKVSIVWLLVHWTQDILDAIDQHDIIPNDYDLSAWRLMHIGAQSVPEDLIRKWLTHFPGMAYDTNYGLTEAAGPGCVHLGIENTDKAGAIGKAGNEWTAIIIDESGNETNQGEIGELIVKGPGLMMGYYHDPLATEEALHNGWLHTGDLARKDAAGFIYLIGRKKDLIITGGEKIYPLEVEEYLKRYDKIKDAAIFGIDDARMGEVITAVIELPKDVKCSKREILEYCQDLPWYKKPRKIIFAPVVRNAIGKIDRNTLKSKYLELSPFILNN